MRNLKKFLALALAMMMTFSLMATANASSFPDEDKAEDAFVEAIDVLAGLGVVKGDEETGNFRPTSSISRAEAAAIMYRIVTGDVDDDHAGLHTGAVQFTDVKDGDWFAGYVGYCADQGIIKGDGDGTFRPYADVTGYEMLAMLLRAVGYGQKNEFTGAGWQIPVGSRATQLGILDNVKTTIYGGNLRVAARRDVVADLAFQAITKPATVTMSSLGDYNEYTSLVSGIKNPTLAEKVFKLKSMTGIIVGNQATGETVTKLGTVVNTAGNAVDISYIYATDYTNNGTDMSVAGTTTNATFSFKTATGLDMFGHKVDVWYKDGTNDASKPLMVGDSADSTKAISINDVYGTIYCVRDLAAKTAVVYSDDANNGTKLGAGTAANPSLGDIAKNNDFTVAIAVNSGIYTSDGYAAITAEYNSNADAGVGIDNGDSNAYLLISNTAADSNGKNALDLIVSLGVSVDYIDAVNNYSKPKTVTHKADQTVIYRDVPTTVNNSLLVYGEESISVGQTVVLNKIYGTSVDRGITTLGTQSYYGIDALTETKQGTVRAIGGDGTVTLTDGTELKQSVLWNVTGGGSGTNDLLIGATLTFLLDVNGAYVDCYVGGATVMLGAYAYWTLEGIDGFKYFLQGVTSRGEIVTHEVTKDSYNTAIANFGPNAVEIHHMSSGTATNGSNVSIVAPNGTADPAKNGINGYQVYSIDGTNTVAESNAWTKIPDLGGANNPVQSWNKSTKGFYSAYGNTTGVPDAGATMQYFNADTKFYVVSGWGSTLKVDTYTGLEDLLQGAESIEAEGWYFRAADDTEHVGSQNDVVDRVILTKITRIQPNTFLYSKDDPSNTEQAATVDGKAHQFQLYVAGADKTTGILVVDDTPGTAWSTGAAANTFYRYVLTAEGYYSLTADKMDGTEYGYHAGNGLTNAGTAMGDINDGTKVYHAADAKVIDLTDHGINDYMTLRRAVEENPGIQVDVLLTSAGGDTASVIYVHTFA